MRDGETFDFPESTLRDWLGIVLHNTFEMDALTGLAGHNEGWPTYEVGEHYGREELDEKELFDLLDEKGFFDWAKIPDGTDAISDYGLRPIMDILNSLPDNPSAGEMLVALNRCLDVMHMRGDLSSIFIEGGRNTLSEISAARYSVVPQGPLLDRLESEPTIRVYRAMQVIDGKLYPPMSARIGKQMQQGVDFDPTTGKVASPVWLESDEHPEALLRDKSGNVVMKPARNASEFEHGVFRLDKAQKNQTNINAAYNPYWHTSRTPLNDQFSAASQRPELVTVETEIPESELTSGYRAEYAKDIVGEKAWHSGPVSSWLAEYGNRRKVILSRYNKIVRVVPDSEVAAEIKRMLAGTDVSIPEGVVTPSLRAELERIGVDIARQGRAAYTWDKIKERGKITLVPFKSGTFSPNTTEKDLIKAGKKSVLDAGGVETERGLALNIPAFGDVIVVGKPGVRHGLRPHGAPYGRLDNIDNADILPVLGEVLKNSVPVNELRPREKDKTDGATVLFGVATDETGAIVPVVSIVNHIRDTNETPPVAVFPLKAINTQGRTDHAFDTQNHGNAPTQVKLADLVAAVKDEIPIFSKDVYKHFKQERPAAKDGDPSGFRYSIASTQGAERLGIGGLSNAEAMEVSGASRLDIWRETGWWRGKDGKWRVEISDAAQQEVDSIIRYFMGEYAKNRALGVSKPRPYASLQQTFGELAEMLSLPSIKRLIQAYPSLADLPLRGLDTKRTKEGYTGGAAFRRERDAAGRLVPAFVIVPFGFRRHDRIRASLVHELQHVIQAHEGFPNGGSPEAGAVGAAERRSIGEGAYRALAGEIEAQLASKRAEMSEADRKAEPPWVTEQRVVAELNIGGMLAGFSKAKGKTTQEIFKEFDNTQREIGRLPDDLTLPPELQVAERVVKGAQAYILDHLVNKPGHEKELKAKDAFRLLRLIDVKNEMRVVPQRESSSLAFIAANPDGGWDCTVIAPRRGEFYVFKTMFAQERKPYQDKALIRYSADAVERNDAADSLLRGPLASVRDSASDADNLPQNGADVKGGSYSSSSSVRARNATADEAARLDAGETYHSRTGRYLYKTMRVVDGHLEYPMAGTGVAIPTGTWLIAEDESAVNPKTGKRETKLRFGSAKLGRDGKPKRGDGKAAPFPGFHMGTSPYMAHIGLGGTPGQKHFQNADYVWVAVDVPMGRTDEYAARIGDKDPDSVMRGIIPEGGMYWRKTNPNMKGKWGVAGAMKIVEVLSDDAVDAILDRDLPSRVRMGRQGGGRFNAQTMRFEGQDLANWSLEEAERAFGSGGTSAMEGDRTPFPTPNYEFTAQDRRVMRDAVMQHYGAKPLSQVKDPVRVFFSHAHFAVVEYHGEGAFTMGNPLQIIGNEDMISDIAKEIKNGTYRSTESLGSRVAERRNGRGQHRRNGPNAPQERGRNGRVDAVGLRQQDQGPSQNPQEGGGSARSPSAGAASNDAVAPVNRSGTARARNGADYYGELFPEVAGEGGGPILFTQREIVRRMRGLVPGYDYKPEHIEEIDYIRRGLEMLERDPEAVRRMESSVLGKERPAPLGPDEQFVLYSIDSCGGFWHTGHASTRPGHSRGPRGRVAALPTIHARRSEDSQ